MVTTRLARVPSSIALALAITLALPAGAATQVLYDPAVTNANPALTGWLDGVLSGASATYGSQGVQITAASNAARAGYSNYPALLALDATQPLFNAAFPVLDSSIGYRLSFGMDLGSEDHSGNDARSGFSVTLIGSNRKGVEIGFQSERILDQIVVFNELVAGTSAYAQSLPALVFEPHRWELTVLGDTYTLTQAGQIWLTGAVHDYSSYTGLGRNAYNTPNFVFLGDNTTSAGANFLLNYVAITTGVPEPSSWAMSLAGLAGLALLGAARRRRPLS